MKMGVFGLPYEYIDRCIQKLGSEFKSLEGKKLTILGGTGFFGSWISSIFIEAINNGLDLKLNILSRSKSENVNRVNIDSSKIKFCNLDIGDGIPKALLDVNFLIFSATSSTPSHGNQDNLSILRTSISFQKAIKEISIAGQVESILNLSSGSVYGNRNVSNKPIKETNIFERTKFNDYQKAKISIEECLMQERSSNPNLKYSSPRLFTFYGPGLPIDAHFAIGNFIGSAYKKEALIVKGNKDTVRSYLHVADASTSLIKILLKPNNEPMNLGSPNEFRIEDLAINITDCFKLPDVYFSEESVDVSYYVPSVENLKSWIGEFESIDFEAGIRDWVDWLKFNS